MMETQRRELLLDTQVALKMGTTVEQYRTQREQRIEKWTKLFHQEMEKWGADDPLQVLPAMLAKMEEAAHATALAASRAVAKKEAAQMVKAMLRKATMEADNGERRFRTSAARSRRPDRALET